MSVNDLLSHLVLNVDDVTLEPWPIPQGENGVTIHGTPEYSGAFLHRSEDGRTLIGIERLGPCTLTGTHAGETLFFLEGLVRCTPEVGEPYTLRKGDFCWFPVGVEDTWVIEETYVKLFSVTVPEHLAG
jgi:uncharacterized cupin superfamily protein